MVFTAVRLGLVAILVVSLAFAQSDGSAEDPSEQKTARGMKITTGITWDSPQEDDSEVPCPYSHQDSRDDSIVVEHRM
jgi:hypothetical protein